MRRTTAAAALSALAAMTACGTPSADLLVVERSGSLPDADLTLVVGDGGAVTCDGVERRISSDRLLEARSLARDLAPLLERKVRLPADPDALLRFRVTGEQGRLAFSDRTPDLPAELGRLLAFTRAVAREACGRRR